MILMSSYLAQNMLDDCMDKFIKNSFQGRCLMKKLILLLLVPLVLFAYDEIYFSEASCYGKRKETKMKKLITLFLLIFGLTSCQVYHAVRLSEKYPECANQPTQSDFINCVNEKYKVNLLDNTNIPVWDWKEAEKTPCANDVYQISKPQPPPISEPKQSTKQPMLLKQCGVPIWNIGDSWKFEDREIKVIRVEGDLYIAENSSSSDLVAYDNNTLEETFSIDDKGGRVKMKSTFPIYFDFPLYVGKKWKRLFSARPSFLNRDYDYLMEYKVLCIEDITVSAGTFKAFKVEINHTNNESKGSGKAHIWYSPEVKLFVKVALDDSSYWRNSQGRELMSFNLKDKETSPEEIKLPIEKVDIAPQVQPTLVEKQKVAPPIAPSLSTHEQGVDIPSKSQPPVTEKKKVPAFAPPPQSTDFVVVTGTSANIRTGAGNEFPIVTTVNQGAKLTLLGEYGKWFNVRLENGQEGWINRRFVQE